VIGHSWGYPPTNRPESIRKLPGQVRMIHCVSSLEGRRQMPPIPMRTPATPIISIKTSNQTKSAHRHRRLFNQGVVCLCMRNNGDISILSIWCSIPAHISCDPSSRTASLQNVLHIDQSQH